MTAHTSETRHGFVIASADLTVKCLVCKDTFSFEHVAVHVEIIVDSDTEEFVHYEVRVLAGEDEFYLQDSLCITDRYGYHCAVYGRTDGAVFALPWLVYNNRIDRWISNPDRDGVHFARKLVKQDG